jgi:putative oxidoreductase
VKPDALPAPVQLAVAWGELVGGLALLLGFLTRIAAAGLAIIMIGAIATVTGENGFPLLNEAGKWNGGFEYNFALLVLCAGAMLAGGGPLAVDRLLFAPRAKGTAAGSPQLAEGGSPMPPAFGGG